MGDFGGAILQMGDLVRYILTPSHAGIVIRFGLPTRLEFCILFHPYVNVQQK